MNEHDVPNANPRAGGPYGPWPPPPASMPPPPPPPGWQQPAVPPGPPPGGRSSRALVGTAVAAALIGLMVLGGGMGLGWRIAHSYTPATQAPAAQGPIRSVPQDTTTSTGSIDAQAVARKVEPAVVDINTVITSLGQTAEAAGTGMVLTSSGEVLTNNHVVQGATTIKATIVGRSGTYTATVLGVDPAADVALLELQGVSGLPTVTLADSSTLSTGQPVVAIGNALGQGGAPTVTSGTITALDQEITVRDDSGGTEQLSGLIQNSAPISPGDSGGPLVNSSGQVVGMITAGSTGRFSRARSMVGFAIPSNTALDVVNQVRSGKATGSSVIIGQPGFLGVGVQTLDPATASRLGLDVSSGVLVTAVDQDSPAARAGITRNSVITAIDGRSIDSTSALGSAIHAHKPGDRMQVRWVDQSGTHNAPVTLISGPAA